ncbi:MAG: DUF1579 domain-containing protein [Planctomycetes bacterium]|nr:DUF1579 domain-containing protein [Planctomycetota bacterium]
MKPIALIAGLAAAVLPVQDMPRPDKLEQHVWLQQLVGEWTATSEATMGPGAEPMRLESTETARSLDGLWIVAEGSASFDGKPFTSILTLGYDPNKKAFVGTWVDTMQTHMWTYSGTLDEAKRVLTLATEGPSFEDPSKTCKFRDVIEIKGPDQKTLTSSMQNQDGTWNTFMRADYRRKKK